ncbi:MAG: TIGR04086 family membrane protein [Butyricicoccus sp.]
MNQSGGSVIAALLTGLVVVFGGTLLCAVLLSGGTIPAEQGRVAVYGCLSAGCILASFLGARRAAAHKLLFGLCPVLCLLGCLFLLAFSWKGQPVQPAAAAAVSAICLLCAVFGSLSGTLLGTKKRK